MPHIKSLSPGSLLYHSIHGLCRIDSIAQNFDEDQKVDYYTISPKTTTRMKTRFILTAEGLRTSAFHQPITPGDAQKILTYLKADQETVKTLSSQPRNKAFFDHAKGPWDHAKMILSFSYGKFEAKDQRSRQLLKQAVQGLAGELAYVFKISFKEAAIKIQQSLGNSAQINPWVTNTLQAAQEEGI